MGSALAAPTLSEPQCLQSEGGVSLRCSCSNCNSLYCTAKKNTCISRFCEHDDISNSCCQYHTIQQNNQDYDQIQSLYLTTTKYNISSKKSEELTQSEVNYEMDREIIIEKNKPPPKSLKECCKLLTKKSSVKMIPKTLNEYIDIISGNADKNKKQVLEKYIYNLKNTKRSQSHPYRCDGKCRKHGDKIVKEIRSAVTISHTAIDSSLNTKTSVQHTEIKQKIDNYVVSPTISNIMEILKKLKEACKVCSCKVCECMPTKENKKEICTCKPCECLDCLSYVNIEKKINAHDLCSDPSKTSSSFHSKCKTPTEMERKKIENCTCVPCECDRCNNKAQQLLNCKQSLNCEYIQCNVTKATSLKTLLKDQPACECAPCECIDCRRIRDDLCVSLTVDESTDTYQYECLYNTNFDDIFSRKCGNECLIKPKIECEKCVDIIFDDSNTQANATLYDECEGCESRKETKKHNMFAMYAALPPGYTTYESFNTNKNQKSCKCEECECLSCVCKENVDNPENPMFSSDEKTFPNTYSFMKRHVSATCSCEPCECQVCTRGQIKNESPHQTLNKLKKRIPNGQSKKNDCLGVCTLHKDKSYCPCRPCRCERCFGDEFLPSVQAHIRKSRPFKKGDVLTPSAHQSKLMLAKFNLPTKCIVNSMRLINHDLTTYNKRELFTYKPVSKPKNNVYDIINKKTVNETKFKQYCGRCDIAKHDAYVQCQDWNKEKPLLQNNFTDKPSESYTSIYSSTISKSSLCKENYYMKSNKNKSWESSCNSSGYDRPEYIIQFPKSARDAACLDDVVKAHFGHNIDLRTFDFFLKHKFLIRDKEKRQQTSKNNLLQRVDSMSTSIETKESRIQHNHRNNKKIKTFCVNYESQPELFKKYVKDRNIHSKISTNITDHKEVFNRSLSSKSNKTIQTLTINGSESPRLMKGKNTYTYYNFLDNKLPEFIRDEDSWTNPQRPSFTCFNHYVDTLNMDEDYERVYKTLKEAKEFSVHLLQLLEMYEKANEEFDKLKIPTTSNFNKVFNNDNDIHEDNIENSNEFLDLKNSPTPWSENSNQEELTLENIIEENASTPTSQKLDLTETSPNMNSDFDETNSNKSSYSLYATYDTIEKTNIVFLNNKKELHNNLKSNTEKSEDGDLINEQYEQSFEEKVEVEPGFQVNDSKILSNRDNIKRKRVHKKNCKKCINHIKLTHKISKKVCLKKPNPNYSAATETASRVSKVLSEGQIDSITQSSSTFQDGPNEETVKAQQQSNQVMTMLGHIYNSIENVPMPTPNDDQGSVSAIEDKLGFEWEEALEEDGRTSTNNAYDNNEVVYRDQAIASCEGQKAKFQLVRKVSDHTVLVKWSQPRVLSDVQGYEVCSNQEHPHCD